MPKVLGAVLRGIRAIPVEIEVGIRQPGKGFRVWGLCRPVVKESEERIRQAFESSGIPWPPGKIAINIAPADLTKDGALLDLPIALGILLASGQIEKGYGDLPVLAFGELSFDGRVQKTRGALAIAKMVEEDSVVLAPVACAGEVAILPTTTDPALRRRFRPLVVSNLMEAVNAFAGRGGTPAQSVSGGYRRAVVADTVDLRDVRGQERAKRALEVAAAGGHNLLFVGPPGEGKSMLAKAMPSILPDLTASERIELTWIYSSSGKTSKSNEIVTARPFRRVHHTASASSIIGGGRDYPMPGEVTLAHLGVLFLDELPEFQRNVLEALRQPLEDGEVHLNRVGGAESYPSDFLLLAAMNPCPCGLAGQKVCSRCGTPFGEDAAACTSCAAPTLRKRCTCTESAVRKYKQKVSGPILDRIDLVQSLSGLSTTERMNDSPAESSVTVRARVLAARQMQLSRYEGTSIRSNAKIPGGTVRKYCEMDASGLSEVEEIARMATVGSTRSHDKLLKIARTIADLRRAALISREDVLEALELAGHSQRL